MQLLWVLTTLLMFITSLFSPALGQQKIHNQLPTDQLCTPAGECVACPPDEINEPYCQPFGSRRLMHCANGTAPSPIYHSSSPPSLDSPEGAAAHLLENPPLLDDRAVLPYAEQQIRQHTHDGETLAWASCGRIVAQERADFIEFVACNVLFAAVALFGVFTRARRMRMMQARQLAARIGLGR
ncbi:hypothetical protein HMN09_00589500 [Mycena chlorophos]|uniref:Uncharacterized protein n=1 Tax=Mycena chlorophos TaxID=658473 RepID=A0A8H6WBP2_MYCCL|nr:hypothetical protein HMN09_00589500 [Mycena chlorophos]